MNTNVEESAKKLNYANLNQDQETRIREVEKSFNNEFSTEFYLMAMEKNKK